MNGVIKRICVLMAERELSVSDLCEAVGIPLTTFYTWRKRDRVPNAEYLPGIAEHLGVTVDYLLTGKEPDYLIYLDDATKILIESVKHLTAGEKIYLSKIAKFIEQENRNEEV